MATCNQGHGGEVQHFRILSSSVVEHSLYIFTKFFITHYHMRTNNPHTQVQYLTARTSSGQDQNLENQTNMIAGKLCVGYIPVTVIPKTKNISSPTNHAVVQLFPIIP